MIPQGRFLAVLAFAFLFQSACSKSKDHDENDSAGVQLTLKSEDLKLLADLDPTQVRIRVFKVENDLATEQEGSESIFPLTQDSGTYKVENVKLGMKQFDVSILNAAAESLGDGTARYLVKPGIQSMDPVAIKIRNPAIKRRDLAMNLWVQINLPGEQAKTTYLETKAIITNNCTGNCHTDVGSDGNPIEPKAGLNLRDFPFVSVHSEWSQDDIVADIVYWMKDPTDWMPIGAPRLPDAQSDLVEKWRVDGLLKFPAADDTKDLATKIKLKWKSKGNDEVGELEVARSTDPEHPFVLSCADFIVTGAYDLTFEVYGIDGSKTYETTVANYIVGDFGSLDQILTIPYSTPSVDIPVVVTRQ